MDRRDFMVATMGAGVGLAGLAAGGAEPAASKANATGNRTVNGNAMQIQRSTLVVNGLDPSALTEEYLDLLRAGGVNCWHQSVGDLASFSRVLSFCNKHQDRIVSVGSVREIRQANQQGKIAHLAGWQSAETLLGQGGKPQIGDLRAYRQLGLRICGIAYNVANAFGAGCAEPQIGLTRAGRRLVEEIHSCRIVLDVGGHTGEQTSLDALEISSGMPVMCSHTNIKTLIDNPRNSSDRVLEAIAKTGGVIGVTAFNDFHARTRNDAKVPRTPQVGLEKHLDQYDYLKKLVGVDHIGLGPDFVTGRRDLNDPNSINRDVMPPEMYSDMPWFYVKGFENISELPNVTSGLLRRGWTPAELRKLLGENWLRIYEKVWGA